MGLCLKFLDWVKVFESLDSSLRYYAFLWLRLLNEVILIVKRWIRRQFTLDEVKKQPGKDVNKSEHDLKDSETNRSIDRLFMATNWSSKANTTESSLSSSWVRFRAQFRSLLRIRFVTSTENMFFLLKSDSELTNQTRPVRSDFFGSSPVFFGSEVDAAENRSRLDISWEPILLGSHEVQKSQQLLPETRSEHEEEWEMEKKKHLYNLPSASHHFLPSFLSRPQQNCETELSELKMSDR